MRITLLATAAMLLLVQSGPSTAQPRGGADPHGAQWHHRPMGAKVGRGAADAEIVGRKPRVCHRPDVGRFSRLVPYSC